MGISTQIYDPIAKPDVSWYCCTFGLPNFNAILFENFGWADTATSNQSNSNLQYNLFDLKSILLSPMRNNFPKRSSGTQLQNLSKFYGVPFDYANLPDIG